MEGRLTLAEVGRDYERYVGYVYERDGWHVQYRGILRGTADLGIDLVCWNDTAVHVVQCKRWSVEKLIDEVVIAKLIEAASAYRPALKKNVINASSDGIGTEGWRVDRTKSAETQ